MTHGLLLVVAVLGAPGPGAGPTVTAPSAAASEALAARPTIAIAPAISHDGTEPWLGLVLADGVSTRLLIHSRFERNRLERVYPLNVLAWRQVASAARSEGLDLGARLDDGEVAVLDEQLGADAMLVLTYEAGPTAAKVHWRLLGDHARSGELAVEYESTTEACEALSAKVLEALGQNPQAVGGHKLEIIPAVAARAYGEALRILGRQSLDPRARVVVSPDDLRRAHELLASATDAAPEFGRAWVERGLASTMLGDLRGAEDELVQGMAQAGDFEPSSSLGLYYFYDRQGRELDARKVLEDSTTTHLGFLQGLGYLAEAYARAGMAHEALQTYTAYVARVPNSPWAKLRRAAALSRLGKHDQAIAETQALVSKHPRSVTLLTALAARQLDAQDYAAAHVTLDRAAAIDPRHPVVLTRLATTALVTGKPDEALALARKAVAAVGTARGEPLAGYASITLAQALELTGNRLEALAALRHAKDLGVDAEDLRDLTRDPRMKSLLTDPRFPTGLLP